MSEPENTTPTPEAPKPTGDSPKPGPPPAKPVPEGSESVNDAMKRALQEANNEAKTLRLKVKAFEDASLTEAEKASADLAAARKEAADAAEATQTAKGRLTRYEVAIEKAVPSHLVEFITGTTREDVEASVAKVLAAFGSSKPTGPRPDPSQGSGGQPVGMNEQIAAAEKAGNTREVIRLKARAGLQTP